MADVPRVMVSPTILPSISIGSHTSIYPRVYDGDGEVGNYTMILSWSSELMKIMATSGTQALLSLYQANTSTIICMAPYDILSSLSLLEFIISPLHIGDTNISITIIDTTARQSSLQVYILPHALL